MPHTMFMYIENPEEYGLDPGMPSSTGNGTEGERKAYGVTWTHEYHCLVSSSKAVTKILEPRRDHRAKSTARAFS